MSSKSCLSTTTTQLDVSDSDNVKLLIGMEAHPKFTEALQYIFERFSIDLFCLNDCSRNVTPPIPASPDDYKNKVMSLSMFRLLCAKALPGMDREIRYSRTVPVPDLTVSQQYMFLDFHDKYWKPSSDDFSSLSVFYNPIAPCLSDPEWDPCLCLSWQAFHSMYVDFALRSPRIVWNQLFAFGFNGDLEWNDELTQTQRALAARGLCVECRSPVTTHMTRLSLKCPHCADCEIEDESDSSFICC